MLHRPQVLFMDEPTVGLDPVARHGVWDLVRNLRERFGATVLITTHLMDEAEALCDRIGVLDAGVLEAVGTPSELKARVGPQATLDDVFAAITDGQIADNWSPRSRRRDPALNDTYISVGAAARRRTGAVRRADRVLVGESTARCVMGRSQRRLPG